MIEEVFKTEIATEMFVNLVYDPLAGCDDIYLCHIVDYSYVFFQWEVVKKPIVRIFQIFSWKWN